MNGNSSFKLTILVILTIFCSNVVAEPIPVFGNTYEVTSVPTSQVTASDFDISTAIRKQIATNPSLLKVNPRVVSQNRVVSLTGRFDDVNQARQLIEIIIATPGVTDLDLTNFVDVNGIPVPPEIISVAKVKLQLVLQKVFGDTPITSLPVTVDSGTVIYLSGTVANEEQAARAIEVAKTVPGVIKVEAKISVAK